MLSQSFLRNIAEGIYTRFFQSEKVGFSQLSIGWLQHKYLKHLPAGKTRRIRFKGGHLFFNAPQELLHGLQEIFIDQIYKQPLPPKALILDCGANIGLSVLWFKQQDSTARIIAFEPDPTNFQLLEQNIAANKLDNVTCHHAAVWKEDTERAFSSAAGMASGFASQISKDTIAVSCLRLKSFLHQPIDFLKIDIEGAEWEVLNDCASSLDLVKRIFIEYHGQFEEQEKLINILNILQNAGFQFYMQEAASLYPTPFYRAKSKNHPYQVQLNIFGFRAGE